MRPQRRLPCGADGPSKIRLSKLASQRVRPQKSSTLLTKTHQLCGTKYVCVCARVNVCVGGGYARRSLLMTVKLSEVCACPCRCQKQRQRWAPTLKALNTWLDSWLGSSRCGCMWKGPWGPRGFVASSSSLSYACLSNLTNMDSHKSSTGDNPNMVNTEGVPPTKVPTSDRAKLKFNMFVQFDLTRAKSSGLRMPNCSILATGALRANANGLTA